MLFFYFPVFIILGEDDLDGIIILFDGQKQYPTPKVTVDFTFVEHTEYDCIEIIAICIPFETFYANKNDHKNESKNENKIDKIENKIDQKLENKSKNESEIKLQLSMEKTEKVEKPEKTEKTDKTETGEKGEKNEKSEKTGKPVKMEFSANSFNSPHPSKTLLTKNLTSGKNQNGGLYSMSIEEKRLLPLIRVFIAAKVFYERIITNKKIKDKRKKRTEQAMAVGSKLTQNMASQSLLGAISVIGNPAYIKPISEFSIDHSNVPVTHRKLSNSNIRLIDHKIEKVNHDEKNNSHSDTTSSNNSNDKKTNSAEKKSEKSDDKLIRSDSLKNLSRTTSHHNMTKSLSGRIANTNNEKNDKSNDKNNDKNTEKLDKNGEKIDKNVDKNVDENGEKIPPYLMVISLADMKFEYIEPLSLGSGFKQYSPYEKMERGSRRNIESMKRRISYNSIDQDSIGKKKNSKSDKNDKKNGENDKNDENDGKKEKEYSDQNRPNTDDKSGNNSDSYSPLYCKNDKNKYAEKDNYNNDDDNENDKKNRKNINNLKNSSNSSDFNTTNINTNLISTLNSTINSRDSTFGNFENFYENVASAEKVFRFVKYYFFLRNKY